MSVTVSNTSRSMWGTIGSVVDDAGRTQVNGSGEVTAPRKARTGRGAPRPSTRRVSPAGTTASAVAATATSEQPGPTAPATGARTANPPTAAAVPVSPPARTRGPVSELPDDRY